MTRFDPNFSLDRRIEIVACKEQAEAGRNVEPLRKSGAEVCVG